MRKSQLRGKPLPSEPRVRITSTFWKQRREQIARVVLPYQWQVLNDQVDVNVPDDPAGNQGSDPLSHAVSNLRIAAGEQDGEFKGMVFQDSDVYKWLEEAAYVLKYHPDSHLQEVCDSTVDIISRAQAPDGYLVTAFQIGTGPWADRRPFTQLQQSHETYSMGHYIEAGVAYYQVTGNRQALNIACRMADCIDAHIGPEEGKLHGADGHPEIELALCKLFEATGEERYKQLAAYLIDVRGRDPRFYAKQQESAPGEQIAPDMAGYPLEYFQADRPVRQQQTAHGHAVRLMYLCTGMAHLAAITQDADLKRTVRRLWRNLVDKRMYITGNIGSTHVGESLTYDYDLPNDTMYGETCASVGATMLAERMLALDADGEYGDILERELFNGALAGISLDGRQYFYVNPLQVDPEGVDNPDRHHVLAHRVDWFGCACCPANIARLIASVDRYIYARPDDSTVLSHQFIANQASFDNGLEVVESTNFPWSGLVNYDLAMSADAPGPVRFGIRVPRWTADSYKLTLDGFDESTELDHGFIYVNLAPGQKSHVHLEMDMAVKLMRANSRVSSDAGSVAVMRGPLVYCAESTDNPGKLWQYRVLVDPQKVTSEFHRDLLGGIEVLTVPAMLDSEDSPDDPLYIPLSDKHERSVRMKLVPYYAWANRETGSMKVWLRS